ncbi:BON domain-containing protein [Echinicola marina]|uniref:BON domain-containing protein n=1 Tax=Echinicola marina TaxID=2859768 RepID=UPI001CF68F1E|nr:BON domain-containing protein [Echinicola marina]UCS92040.1 BON domain-containing protein [Echinicola marina]
MENAVTKRQVAQMLGTLNLAEPNYVHIEINEGNLFLKGYVQSWMDRDNIEDSVRSIPGIESIVNDLEVKVIPQSD